MIGEKLEEARKRNSISIREAAEATKIRGDYLMKMEDNSFDINLPDIYIRGFLKNYAKFLRLDADKILTDFDAQMLGKSIARERPAQAQHRESFGRMEIDEENEASSEADETATSTLTLPGTPKSPPPPTLDNESTSRDEQDWADSKALYFKIGVIFAGLVIVATILVVLVRLVLSGDDPQLNPELAGDGETEQVAEPAAGNATSNTSGTDPFAPETIRLIASDNVTVIVEQTIDRERLFSGSLNAGETISIEKEGPVSIRFTNGTAFQIEKNGQTFQPGSAGVGRTVVQ